MRALTLAILATTFLSLGIYSLMATPVSVFKVQVDSFEVIGLRARTTNAREMTAEGVIGPMWARAGRDKLLDAIPNRLGLDVVVLYTDYESDKDGAYTYILGTKVSSGGKLPGGFVRCKVPAGEYQRFTGAGTIPSKVVLELWQRVWSLENTHQITRAYKTDFEVHRASDGKVDLYVGLSR